MSESTEQRLRMRRYLLGQLSESECQSVEQQFVSDSNYRQEVRILEDDLVDDYVTRRMSHDDLAQFEAHYLVTQQKQEKVLVARALNSYVLRRRRYRWLGVDRRTAYALAASVLIVTLIALGLWFWLNRRPGKPVDTYQAQIKSLNDGTSTVTPSVRSIILPNSTKHGSPSVDVAVRKSTRVVELLLILPQVEYERFGAVITSEGTHIQYTLTDLVSQMSPDGKVLAIKLPAELLKPDTYYIDINVVNQQGQPEVVADYTFSASLSDR
jgi:hypothetical protein